MAPMRAPPCIGSRLSCHSGTPRRAGPGIHNHKSREFSGAAAHLVLTCTYRGYGFRAHAFGVPRNDGLRMRRLLQLLTALFCVVAFPAPGQAPQSVDLALVLAVDASGSVDRVRFELQKQGYVAA